MRSQTKQNTIIRLRAQTNQPERAGASRGDEVEAEASEEGDVVS
jgi:hypothetical protein